jgi:hypothetical protein
MCESAACSSLHSKAGKRVTAYMTPQTTTQKLSGAALPEIYPQNTLERENHSAWGAGGRRRARRE